MEKPTPAHPDIDPQRLKEIVERNIRKWSEKEFESFEEGYLKSTSSKEKAEE